METTPTPLLFTLSETQALGAEIAREAKLTVSPLEEQAFPEGEFKLRPLTSVRGRDVFVVQSLAGSADAPLAHRLLRLLFAMFSLRDAEAASLTAVLPYLSFARQERRTQVHDAVNTRYIAQLLETAGAGRLLALDVHSATALDNAFRIPVDHLSTIPMFVDHFAGLCAGSGITVVSPDIGGVKRVQVFRALLERRLRHGIEMAFVEKRRAGGVLSGGRLVGQARGREVIILDDLCASGSTLLRAATVLRDAGAGAVHVAFTHAPLAQGLEAVVASGEITRIVLTDSIGPAAHITALKSLGPRVQVLSVAPLFGAAIARMTSGRPLGPLLDSWPASDGA